MIRTPPPLARVPPALNVLSLNMHKGFSSFNQRFILHELRDAVRNVAAELVFLQETIGAHDSHQSRHPRWPSAAQYEFLADAMWPAHAYGRNAVYPEGHHGNALMSKFPILRFRNHEIVRHDCESRGLLHCVLDWPSGHGELHAICVHLGLRARDRRDEIARLCALIDAEIPPTAPLIIAGDFNDWCLDAHERLSQCANLHEVFASTRGRPARTFPARWPLLALDRIYARHLAVRHRAVLAKRPWSHLSDHAGLYAELVPCG